MIDALAAGCQNHAFVGCMTEVVLVKFTPLLFLRSILVVLDRQSRGRFLCIHSKIVLGLHVDKDDFSCQ